MINAQVKYKASHKGLEDLIRMMQRLEADELGNHEESNEREEEVLDAMHDSLEPDESEEDVDAESEALSPEDEEFEAEKREFMKRSGKTPSKGSTRTFFESREVPPSKGKAAPQKKGA